MKLEEVKQFIKSKYSGLVLKASYAEEAFFYNPEKLLKNGVYFVTLKSIDGPNDKASNLSRKGIYRLSFSPGDKVYEGMFGSKPKRPKKGEVVELEYDFTEQNILLPHPVYAWMGWMCILNPGKEFFDNSELLDGAYDLVQEKYRKKVG